VVAPAFAAMVARSFYIPSLPAISSIRWTMLGFLIIMTSP
jgi:hypothetical protein